MPERIKIYNAQQDRVVETTQRAFDQTLAKRGWVLHEPEKYTPPAPLAKPTVEKFVKEPVKETLEQPQGKEVDLSDEPAEFVPEPLEKWSKEDAEKMSEAKKETKPAATRGRKPNTKKTK